MVKIETELLQRNANSISIRACPEILTAGMNSRRQVVVSGAAVSPFNRRQDGSSFRDWSSEVFSAALHQSTLERSDINALFVSSESDFFSLQLNPASVLASDLGLTGVYTSRIEGGGASGQLAVHAAARAIQSGQARHVAVVGVDPSASGLPADTIRSLYGYSFDAWSDGMTGVTSTTLYALSFQAFMARTAASEDHLAQVSIQNRSNALKNPGAHLGRSHTREEVMQSPMIASPYRRLHCSPLSDGAAAVILTHKDAVPVARTTAPAIVGMGGASDTIHLGARADPGKFNAKRQAMQCACKDADIRPRDVGAAEIYDSYAGAYLQALEALGFSDSVLSDFDSGRFAPSGDCPVNLSGGLMGQGAPTGATGVAQTATCALLLEGRYIPAIQPADVPRYALADTHGGVCTTAAITVLEKSNAL